MELKRYKDFLNENIYDDKLSGKINDLSFLLEQLRELIDGNDLYKATVKKEGDKIVIKHEIKEKSQELIIRDNGQQNDFFLMSGTDKNGKSIDDMGEQPSETIFLKISQMFQEFTNENSNLDKSVKTLSKFGMFPEDKLIATVKDLLSIYPTSVMIFDDGDMNIFFHAGSSLINDIKNDLKNDELINIYYDLSNIGFDNHGDEHAYILNKKGNDQQDNSFTIKDIAQDIIDNSDISEDDLELLEYELDKYLQNSSYPIEEKDYKDIILNIKNILNK